MKKIERFGTSLSRIGFGGGVVMNENQDDADRYVEEAFAADVNYFDVAPTYGDAEIKMGNALKGRRNDIFLACKTEDRTAEGAKRLLDQSLKNLKTDHFDLYQCHAVYDLKDVDRIFGHGGAFETILRAKEEGMIKHVGFSAHSTEAALAMMDHYDFDSILFPFNFVSMMKNGYGKYVLRQANERHMTILGIKVMVLTEHMDRDDVDHPKAWYHPIEDEDLARKAVAYSLEKGVDIFMPPGDIRDFRRAVRIMEGSLELKGEDRKALRAVVDKTVPLFPLKRR